MSERSRDAAAKAAKRAQAAILAEIGADLMNGYNQRVRDPESMARLGHDTSRGFEFSIERRGVEVTVIVERDLE